MRLPKVAFGLIGILSCSNSPTPPTDAGTDGRTDMGGDTPQPMTCTPRPFEMGSAEGDPNPLMVAAGSVRAGRLEESELPTSRTGLAYWKTGDYVLANERVALLVEAARPSDGYLPWGGAPVGVARVEGGRLVEAADFNEILFGLGRYIVATESVTVTRNGSDGTATVRAVGPMQPIPFLNEFARNLIPTDYSDVRVALDYVLRPNVDYVDLFATFDVQNPDGHSVEVVTNAFFQGYRMSRYFPGYGFFQTGDEGSGPTSSSVFWIDDEATSWGWQNPAGNLEQFVSTSGFDLFTATPFTLPGCKTAPTPRHMGRILIGGKGLDGLQQAAARANNATLREIRGQVTDAGGAPAAGVRVHASRAAMAAMGDAGMQAVQQELTRATTDAMGNYVLHVPDGMAVNLSTWRRGDSIVGPIAVAATQATANITLNAAGSIHVVATEVGTGMALPVRVQVLPMGATLPSAPSLQGESNIPAGRLHVEFPINGDITLKTPPGSYRVVVSRGFEYDLSDTNVMVTAGTTTEVPVMLRRVVDTPSVMCGDFHIHTTRSPDSRDPARFKLASAAGDGLEIPARSEHEFVSEWQSIIEEMGLTRWMYGITSLELTTFAWGHFGVVPMVPDAARRNRGSFDWAGRAPPAVFADVRARPEQSTFIVNHPRGPAISAYFTAAGYDPATGTARRPDLWDDRFTVVEFFNDSSFYDSSNRENLADWYSFLNRNRRVYAVGSSDSHSIQGGSPVGFPRTCMYLGTNEPRMATPNTVRDALANGRSFISGGVFIDITATPVTGGTTTVGPGQELTGAGTMARFTLRVQAAPWVTTDRLEIIANGMVAQTIMLDDSRRDPMNPTVRYRGDVMIPVPATGAWVIAAARGAALEPVHPGRNAFGVTNPIFLRP
jgi:hypothetical protein